MTPPEIRNTLHMEMKVTYKRSVAEGEWFVESKKTELGYFQLSPMGCEQNTCSANACC